MASSFKESNNIYTKRPAVALFRKPLVNNDEMSDILEGMLDIYASVEQQSVSKYVGPKYKAIYWNHLTGLPFIEKYGELFTFYRVSPPADPFAYSSANTAISVLTDSYPSPVNSSLDSTIKLLIVSINCLLKFKCNRTSCI